MVWAEQMTARAGSSKEMDGMLRVTESSPQFPSGVLMSLLSGHAEECNKPEYCPLECQNTTGAR